MSRYRFIAEQRNDYPVARLCAVLRVSESGFYDWQKRTPSVRAQANEALAARIRAVHERSRQTYGYLRVHAELRAQGEPLGKHRVARLMAEGVEYLVTLGGSSYHSGISEALGTNATQQIRIPAPPNGEELNITFGTAQTTISGCAPQSSEGQLTIFVFYDNNGNGVFDAGEVPQQPDGFFYLDSEYGGPVFSIGADGYGTLMLPHGVYSIGYRGILSDPCLLSPTTMPTEVEVTAQTPVVNIGMNYRPCESASSDLSWSCPAGTTAYTLVDWRALLTMDDNPQFSVPLTLPQGSPNGFFVLTSMVGHPEAGCPSSGSDLCGDQDNESFNVLVDGAQTLFIPDHGNDQIQLFKFAVPISAGAHEITFAHSMQAGNNPHGSVYLDAIYCASSGGSTVAVPQQPAVGSTTSQPAVSAPPAPMMPLCAGLDGTTSSVVRANMPADAYGVHCNVLAQNGSGNMAAIGVQSVLDMGVIHAVDVFAPSSGSVSSAEICLQGQGGLVFLSAANSPRVPQSISVFYRDGYTCGTINGEGTLVLVQQP